MESATKGKRMELGIYSFGNGLKGADGEYEPSAWATRNLVEAIKLADEVGLDFFGIGEHHTKEMPASAAATILAAAASITSHIQLGSAVTVLSTDDPVRVYQQFATLDAVSNGRAEITAGRGSSTESFPLFGYRLEDYDTLYAEKLDLLLALNESDTVTWTGTMRPSLEEAVIVPRPESGRLRIWLGTGGNPGSTVRAARLGMPISYGIIGGRAARFAQLGDLYRRAAAEAGTPLSSRMISVGTPGFIAPSSAVAHDTFWKAWNTTMSFVGGQRGFLAPPRSHFDAESHEGGALFVGEPEQIAERMIIFQREMGHMRHFLQTDVGQLPHREFLRSIELLGTQVKPLVDAELGARVEVAV
jgi:probable LLM family oxidoreductase